MPIVALVLPWVLLQLTSVDISMEQYLERMRGVLLQQITIPTILKSRGDQDVIGFLLERLFIGITLVTFISGIWNQISPALHLRSIWFTLEDQGMSILKSLEGLVAIRACIPQRGMTSIRVQIDDILDHVGYLQTYGGVATYAHFYKDKTYLQKIIALYSKLDVLVTLAERDDICFPRYVKDLRFDISGAVHPIVSSCVSNNYSSRNALLTGPNRGGKSTFCKALGLAVLTAQSWGFAWASQMTLSPFTQTRIALTPAPSLGVCSTFEAEIDFAKSVHAADTGYVFVMMDEIFHSTNAHDGVQASRIFLSQLYKKPNCISLISTHYHELATEFGTTVAPLCMNATQDGVKLAYTYKVSTGISNLSSVLEILEERGLYAPGDGSAVEQKN
jgi:hypothetical protein